MKQWQPNPIQAPHNEGTGAVVTEIVQGDLVGVDGKKNDVVLISPTIDSNWTEVDKKRRSNGKQTGLGIGTKPLFCSNGFGNLGFGIDLVITPQGVT